MLNPGDEVLLPRPGYENYRLACELLGAKPVYYDLSRPSPESKTWGAPAAEALERLSSDRLKLVVVNSPSNPTGTVFATDELQRFVDFVDARPECVLLSDEIYGGVYFGRGDRAHAPSIFECDLRDATQRIVACSGVSKELAMTGFRVGWLATKSRDLAACATKLQEPMLSCGVPFAQAGAEAALRSPQTHAYAREMRDAYRSRRDAALDVLVDHGRFEYVPEGAFYLLVNTRGRDSVEFANHVLDARGVACAPGAAFGIPDVVRVSLAAHEDDVRDGITALCEELAR